MSNVWTLLITDDCAEDREIYREYLSGDPNQSYRFIEASSAEVGLDLWQKNRFDAVLLDFCLPDMTGLEFLDELRQKGLEGPFPVIMLTGQGDERVAVQALKRGAQDYLVKQHLQPDVLQHTVRNVIRQAHQHEPFEKIQDRQNLTSAIALRIRQSNNLDHILQTAITEVHHLLECDRVGIYRANPHSSQAAGSEPILTKLYETGLSRSADSVQPLTDFLLKHYSKDSRGIWDTFASQPGQVTLLSHRRGKTPGTYLLAPILLSSRAADSPAGAVSASTLWGLLVAGQESDRRQWQSDEIEMLTELAGHLAIAIAQAEQLNQAIADLESEKQLNRFKTQIVTTISHEYRTPLAAILAAASTLKLHGERLGKNRQQQFLRLIEDKARQMTQLVEDLLVIETFECGKANFTPLPFELLQFFSDIVEEQRQTMSDRHTITFRITGNTKGFWGDQRLLRQILVNLLSNAIKYSPDGGNIDVNLTGNDARIIFEIKDEGIGIPLEDQIGLFERFHRCSNVDTIPGTGLGLTIVKACVDLHGGDIQLQSQPGQGTSFIVSLPKRSPQ